MDCHHQTACNGGGKVKTNGGELSLVRLYRSFLINITEKCNLRCRHCGYGDSTRKGQISSENLRLWIPQILEVGVSRIIVTGGEPFINFNLLTEAAKLIDDNGGSLGVFTSGFFGASEAAAKEKLSALPSLATLYISTDTYHWEFVSPESAMNVINAAYALGVRSIIVCVNYSQESELNEVLSRLKPVSERVNFNLARIIRTPFVDRQVSDIDVEPITLNAENFKTSCHLHTPLINPTGTVTMCHVGKEETHGNYSDSPYILGNLNTESLREILTRAESNPIYDFLLSYGPRGVAKTALTADEIPHNQSFTSDCDMCCKLLPHPQVLAKIEDKMEIVHSFREAFKHQPA